MASAGKSASPPRNRLRIQAWPEPDRGVSRCIARIFPSGIPTEISCDGSHILALRKLRSHPSPEPLPWAMPGITDLQVNGFKGVDFQRDDISPAELCLAAMGLRQTGCSSFLATLITAPFQTILHRLRHLKALRASDPFLREMIAGWHVEGPFLSDKPGYHGAHDPSFMEDPSPAKIRALRKAGGDLPMLLTLAPERRGAEASIREATRLGMGVSLGHTQATTGQIERAMDAGATGFTHLGNGCPQSWDRHDNILWRVLEQPGLRVGLIPDAIHVSPALFRILHRVIDPSRFWYVTDAMAAAGMAPGRYPLAGAELEVGRDQVVRKPGSELFAGSALTPLDGVWRAAWMLGSTWQETWPRFSTQPAEWMALSNSLRPGAPRPVLVREEK